MLRMRHHHLYHPETKRFCEFADKMIDMVEVKKLKLFYGGPEDYSSKAYEWLQKVSGEKLHELKVQVYITSIEGFDPSIYFAPPSIIFRCQNLVSLTWVV